MLLDGIETDIQTWPIVVHRTIGVPSDAHVDAFIEQADALLARAEPYVVIFDSTLAGRVSGYMRKRSSEWLANNSTSLAKYCHGTALVFPSAAFRFVLSTILLISPSPVPHKVHSNLDEAMEWARAQLRRARASRSSNT